MNYRWFVASVAVFAHVGVDQLALDLRALGRGSSWNYAWVRKRSPKQHQHHEEVEQETGEEHVHAVLNGIVRLWSQSRTAFASYLTK